MAYLEPATALVVLDNCEHVICEAAQVAEPLAKQCPGVSVLATSREPLRVPGETEWRVPSMALAPIGDDAVRLVVERAVKVRPQFRLTETNTAAVERVCRELDGIGSVLLIPLRRSGITRPLLLYHRARDAFGGVLYPIGAVPLSQDDWRVHYGQKWRSFTAARNRFDPHGILAPGAGIFSS